MNLYLANGVYVGTQAEARKLDKGFKPVTVPVDKDGLIRHLNMLLSRPTVYVTPVPFFPTPTAHPAAEAQIARNRDMGAAAILSRLDGPANIDAMCETICQSAGYPLKRFAASVACAFTRLADGVR